MRSTGRRARSAVRALSASVGLLSTLAGCFAELPGRAADPADGDPPELEAPPVVDAFVDGESDGDPTDGPTLDGAPEPEPDVMPELDAMPEPDFGLDPDMALPDAAPPVDLGPPAPDAAPPEPEICNGLDDDLNGVIDDAPVCGQVIAQNCRLYLGWANDNAGPADGAASWGACPADDVDDFGFRDDLACRGTRGDRRFRRISMGAGVDDNDDMGVAFQCSGGPPGVAEWVQSACEVWLGQADNNLASGAEVWDDWGACIARHDVGQGPDPGWVCDSSGGDGLFHRISLIGGVDGNDAFAVAFRCVDQDDPERAAAAQASAAAFLTWDRWSLIGDGVEEWSTCPGDRNDVTDNGGDQRCASSAFDGRFHRFQVTGNVDSLDAFGIALLPHPDAP